MANALDRLYATYRILGHDDWVRPAYDGQCTVNLMRSLLSHFGAEHAAPLAFHDEFLQHLIGKRKVLFLLLDGMGWLNLARASAQFPVIGEVFLQAKTWPLTTIFPSTTTTATTTYVTASFPSEHGVIGYLMYFPAFGNVFNMLHFRSPDAAHQELLELGFNPKTYVKPATVFERLRANGVLTGAYNYHAYAGSGLSRMLYPGNLPSSYVSLGDMLDQVMQYLSIDQPQFHLMYWATLDTIAHQSGAGSRAYALELSMLALVIRDLLLPNLDDDTALVLCSDHGHIDGDDAEAIDLAAIPGLAESFRMVPAGEGRETHLFLREGSIETARKSLQDTGVMRVLSKQELLDEQLLGPTPLQAGLHAMIGDLVLLPYGSRRTVYPYEPRLHTAMIGRHGGLSLEEMIVPMIIWA